MAEFYPMARKSVGQGKGHQQDQDGQGWFQRARNKFQNQQGKNEPMRASPQHHLPARDESSPTSTPSTIFDEYLTRRSSGLEKQAQKSSSVDLRTQDKLKFTYSIRARLFEAHIHESVIMRASLDTQCLDYNLMSERVWKRIKGRREWDLEPCQSVVLPLESKPFEVIGIARNIMWGFRTGLRTYVSNFYIVEMSQFDVLIGTETIVEEELLKRGDDLPFINSRLPLSELEGTKEESVRESERREGQEEDRRLLHNDKSWYGLLIIVLFDLTWMATTVPTTGKLSAFITILRVILDFYLMARVIYTEGFIESFNLPSFIQAVSVTQSQPRSVMGHDSSCEEDTYNLLYKDGCCFHSIRGKMGRAVPC